MAHVLHQTIYLSFGEPKLCQSHQSEPILWNCCRFFVYAEFLAAIYLVDKDGLGIAPQCSHLHFESIPLMRKKGTEVGYP